MAPVACSPGARTGKGEMFDIPSKNKLNIYIDYLFQSHADFIFSVFSRSRCRSCAGGSCPPSFSAVDRPEQPTTVSSKHRKTAAVLWNLCLRWKHFLPLGCRIGKIRRRVKEGKKRKTVLRAWEAFKKKEARNHVSKGEPRPQVFPPGGSQCGVCYRFCVFPWCAVRGGKAKQVLFSTG